MAALTLRAGEAAIAPLRIGDAALRCTLGSLQVSPAQEAEEAAAVANALYGTSSDEEDSPLRAQLRLAGTGNEATLHPLGALAAATPRAGSEEPATAISEDSSLAAAAGEVSLVGRPSDDQHQSTLSTADKAAPLVPASSQPLAIRTAPAARRRSVGSPTAAASAAKQPGFCTSPAARTASSPTAAAAAVARPAAAAPAASGSMPLPRRRCVLVAKQLTNSDASSGRIILPRVAVESNLSFVLGYRHYALAVKDCHGRRYEFMIKSWANGTEHRRVFVLEQAGEFLRSHGVGVGDAVGICTDENGELVVEANTDEVRQATVSPKYGALALQAPPPGATAAVPLVAGATGRCIRSPHCTKAAGHPGFCSGPKAAAAAAAKQLQAASKAVAASHCCQPGTSEASARGAAAATDTSGEEAATRLATPRSRHAAVSSTAEFAAAQRQAAAAAAAKLPDGLHEIAHIPTGLRIAKVLTAYDISSRRVVMPVPEVEAGIPNAPTTDLLTLAAVDESQRWHFPTLHAWTNVAGRRGYLLDGLAPWLVNRGVLEGDLLLVFRDSELSPPRVELRAGASSQSRRPAAAEASAPSYASLPLLLHPKGAGPATAAEAAAGGSSHGRGVMLLSHQRRSSAGVAVCRRTTTCTKPAGHQGFCSGHKGFKRRESPTASAALGARRPFGRYRDDDWMDEDDEYLTASDDDSSLSYGAPSRAAKRPRRTAAAAAVAAAAAAASREASPVPPPASDPLLSLLCVLDTMESSVAATSAVEQAVLTAEAAANAAYGAVKQAPGALLG